MKTISVLSSKGGAGKTTLVKSLLTAASHKGARAAFIECDQNGSLLSWAKNAALNGLWPEGIDAYQVLDIQKLSEVLEEIRSEGEVDYIFIDTEGRASEDHHHFVFESDLLLIPMMLSRTDIEVTRGLLNWLHRLPSHVDKPELLPKARVVLNSVAGKSPSKAELGLLELIGNQNLVGESMDKPTERMEVLESVVRDREAYRIMDVNGPLNEVIKQHNATAQPFQKNPVWLVDALKETATALHAVDQLMENSGG
uniref:ATPase involved in chromosome partitioning n=1 Tax=uncultured Thiotrichaceae bacterium TaxID=298394 RepID=A0A6S6TQD5_9GAMM|nr:MAG: ATPase involved in chromosome partitioning [uncultured Thiotrichaceae bacterium]